MTMKNIASLFSVLVLIVVLTPIAQSQDHDYFIFGINLLMPSTRGEVTRPREIVKGYGGQTWMSKSVDISRSRGLLGFSMGGYIVDLRTSFTANGSWAQASSPAGNNSTEFEFSGRYSIVESVPVKLLAIASVRGVSAGSSTGSERAYGGYFARDYWTPGIGLGIDFSIIHADIRVHGWPHTKIADASVPSGPPPAPYGEIPFTLEPVYLKYDVSLNAGIEFHLSSARQ